MITVTSPLAPKFLSKTEARQLRDALTQSHEGTVRVLVDRESSFAGTTTAETDMIVAIGASCLHY
jgi:hypothetical protein